MPIRRPMSSSASVSCGKASSGEPGSASPSIRTTNGRQFRPASALAISSGSAPPPATMPTVAPAGSGGKPSAASRLVIAVVIGPAFQRRDGEVPLAAAGNEIDDLHGRRRAGEFGARQLDVLGHGARTVEDHAVGPLQLVDF